MTGRVIIPAVLGVLLLGFAALRVAAGFRLGRRPRFYRSRTVFDLAFGCILIGLAIMAARA